MTVSAAVPVCPACSGSRHSQLPWGTGPDTREMALTFELYECSTCGLVRLQHLMETAQLEGYSLAFYLMLREGMSGKSKQKGLDLFDARAELFSRLKAGRLLDVGCERGFFLESMKRRGWTVHGTEPFEPFARFAQDEFGLDVRALKLQDLECSEGFDLLTLWHVLEHFPDPIEALRHCARLLRPGGVLFFEVPNIDGIGPWLSGQYWLPFREPTHRWFFRVGSLQRLVEKAGLTLEAASSGHTRDAWYGLKRGVQGRVTGVEYFHSKLSPSLPSAPSWKRAVASAITFYPVMKLAAWSAAQLQRGEILRGWCRRPLATQ